MHCKTSRKLFCGLLLLTAFFSRNASSAYIEGIDTTDVNGYGFDSVFRIDSSYRIHGNNTIFFGLGIGAIGLFSSTFEDTKLVPSNAIGYQYTSFCIVMKKDNTYSKVQVLNKLPDKRYLFKFGTNTTPNDRFLENADYDRSIRYKPNNIFITRHIEGYSIYWEPVDGHFKIGHLGALSKCATFKT
jgi:hypothetical protein